VGLLKYLAGVAFIYEINLVNTLSDTLSTLRNSIELRTGSASKFCQNNLYYRSDLIFWDSSMFFNEQIFINEMDFDVSSTVMLYQILVKDELESAAREKKP
jgi:hypothetical protein